MSPVLGMQMKDWFSDSEEWALFPGDIPSSEPTGQLLPRSSFPAREDLSSLPLGPQYSCQWFWSQPQVQGRGKKLWCLLI